MVIISSFFLILFLMTITVPTVVQIFYRYQAAEAHRGSGDCCVHLFCTALLSWITHAHLVPLCVTKRHPVQFILNLGHIEYELGVLMV